MVPTTKETKYVLKFSGGKDSTALLIKCLEEKLPLDLVVFNDTGMEFPQLYDHISQVVADTGVHLAITADKHSYLHYFRDKKNEMAPAAMAIHPSSGAGVQPS